SRLAAESRQLVYYIGGKTDALDRFGTRLEQRFSKKQITAMLHKAGFTQVEFSSQMPYWVCVSYKSAGTEVLHDHQSA
ncbi:MAG: hypothetical protein HC848_02140, partial [Limnobacter sp.]|nr:hypothetical protein [Limnobacter sp.]